MVAALAATSCSADRGSPAPATTERWRGDVSFPGLPAIGVLVRFEEGEDADASAHLIAAPNMGFGSAQLESLVRGDDVVSFDWTIDGALVGPCSAGGRPDVGFRLVPPGSDEPTGLARTLLQMSSVQWLSSDTGVTRVWVAATDTALVDRAAVHATVAEARERNVGFFGDSVRTQRVDVFVVEGRDQMRRFTGAPSGGRADPMASTVVLIGFGTHRIALVHEVTHALSFYAWGPPSDGASWLREGLATWLAGACRGHGIHDLARDMRTDGALLPLRTLVDEFERHDDLVSYLQSGSVVGFLVETHGVDAFRRVWTGGEDGLRAMDYGIAQLERDWLRFLDATPRAESAEWESIRGVGCG